MGKKEDTEKFVLKKFSKMKTIEDLLFVLEKIRKFYDKENGIKSKPLTKLSLNGYKLYTIWPNSFVNMKRYHTFHIKKKSGTLREISAPCKGLKRIQTYLNFIFQTFYEPNANAVGFVPGRSIADGAKKHIRKKYVLNIDLKDFFDSVELYRVKSIFTLPPFNLKDDRDNPQSLPYVLATLCCHPKEVSRFDKDGNPIKCVRCVTPQGAPTSPIITNLVCRQLDRRLLGLAKRFKLSYSRYADDITFSTNKKDVFMEGSVFMAELKRIVEDQKFHINDAKTRVQSRAYRQEVTGLVVNSKVNVTKRYVKQIRMWLYLWERYGYEKASECFERDYSKSKGEAKRGKYMENVIEGKLNYMKMIVGEDNDVYKKLQERFDKLVCAFTEVNVASILDIWEKDGIDAAITAYEKFNNNEN